ncbi:MAG: hypothetical protein LBH38_03365 [Holosporales bacterium]|jgi:hypothetical protein|nr:hypothetical protein [Holosporales bacterium]
MERVFLLFRLPGFPALVALWKLILGGHWTVGVMLSQFALVVFVGFFMYRLMRDLAWSSWIRFFVLFSYSTGIFPHYARYMLTDSVYGSLALLSVLSLCRICLDLKVQRVDWVSLFLSIFIMGFWRETTPYFVITLLLLIVALFKFARKKAAVVFVGLCFVTAIPQGTLMAVHKHTCGLAIVSAGTASALLWGMSELSCVNPDFIKETFLKEEFPNGGSLDPGMIRSALHRMVQKRVPSCTSFRMDCAYFYSEIKRDFFASLINHPLDYLKINARGEILRIVCCTHGPLRCFGKYSWSTNSLLQFIYEAFLTGIGLVYALYNLPLFFRRVSIQKDREALIRCALLFHALGFILVYALFHLEYRYVISSTVLMGVLGWWGVADFVNARRKIHV